MTPNEKLAGALNDCIRSLATALDYNGRIGNMTPLRESITRGVEALAEHRAAVATNFRLPRCAKESRNEGQIDERFRLIRAAARHRQRVRQSGISRRRRNILHPVTHFAWRGFLLGKRKRHQEVPVAFGCVLLWALAARRGVPAVLSLGFELALFVGVACGHNPDGGKDGEYGSKNDVLEDHFAPLPFEAR